MKSETLWDFLCGFNNTLCHILNWAISLHEPDQDFCAELNQTEKNEISIRNTGQIRHVTSIRLEHVVLVSFQTSSVPLLNWKLVLTNTWWSVVILIVSMILHRIAFLYSRSQEPPDGLLSPEYNQTFRFLYSTLCL